jgi:Dyp-type peroxidase family
MSDRLQPGIYFRAGQRPPACFRLLVLNARAGAEPAAVRKGLARLLDVLPALADGGLRDLTGQDEPNTLASAEQFAGLAVLLGFGRRLFDPGVHEPPLVQAERPEYLSYLAQTPAPFPRLPWTDGHGSAEGDFAIQLTAEREAGVNCAAIEAWKLIGDERLPFDVVATFSGFGRHDGRGWLDFHDGVSNIETSQRLEALEAPPDPPWMAGGTYMAYLRLAINLAAWRRLSRDQQALIVGRDKLTGAALTGVDRSGGHPRPVAAAAKTEDERLASYRDPPQTTDPLLEASHIHRANQNRASPGAPAGLRIFRQGYDYLDGIDAEGPRLGLNFVSFQRDLANVHHLLHLQGWLGDVNFGGPREPVASDPPAPQFIEVEAGGLYAIPPVAAPFPGAEVFG